MKALIVLAMMLSAEVSFGDAVPGKPAPAFEVKDATGKVQKLSDYKDKWIVMEWFNKDCPYVKKHYGAKNMQDLQKKYTDKGVVWLTVNSSAKGKQGYTEAQEAVKVAKENSSAATAVLLDSDGKVGKAYGAKTTPHMFVINPKGEVVYAGAIDDNDSSEASTIPKSKNYVATALDQGMSGKKIETAAAKPYGCGTKY